MSSSSQSSSSLPVRNCTAPLLDFDLQEKFLLPHATELNSKNIDTLMQKLSENETQNTDLRRKITEKEKHVEELSSRLQLEKWIGKGSTDSRANIIEGWQDLIRSLNQRKGLSAETNIEEEELSVLYKKVNIEKEGHLSRSVKAVQAHLQCQIQRKEVENDELKVKIQSLEKKIAEWKLQVGEYKRQMLALRETSEQKKTALKNTIRSQKQRAEGFEAAVENLTSRIREREVKLSEILSASDAWKSQHDRMVEGKTTLQIQVEDLKKQITSLLEDLKEKEEWRRNSDEEILGKLNSVNSENEKIYLENEKLKAYLATLENSADSVENELINLQEKAKMQENLVERYKNQVQKLQTAVEEFKSRCGTVLNENKRITENKCLEVDKVRDKTEAELKELEHVCDLLKAAEEQQQGYQDKLVSWERIHTQKCKTLKEMQVQASSTRNEFSFSHEEDSVISMGSHSLEEENYNIQKKYEDLKRQLEKMEFQNEELAYQLKKEDENLQCSKLQLEEKIVEYNGLTRQLESALEEGRKMIAEELEKMSYKEQGLQTKILALETEVREGQEEKKQLLCVFHHNEKHHELCLKELENSLQKSENKNQSIQNYVQFLKASYVTMFG